jgi:gliding motility-associated-like protein
MKRINSPSIVTYAFFFLFSLLSYGQNTTMTNGTLNLCSGTLLDPGGLANYPNNSNITTTICPLTPGGFIQLSFTTFDTELNFDDLTIYDGPTTAAPILGIYSGVLSAFSVQASNPTGCLTLVFQSDGFVNSAGFAASIACIFPCQAFTAQVVSTTPAAVGGFINICEGQSLSVSGAGNYPNSPGNYAQSNATTSFKWDFGDLTAVNQATGTHTYLAPGVYDLDLNLVDVNGCKSSNDINLKVRVSGPPSFTNTNSTSSEICFGQTNTLTGFAQAAELTYFCESENADTTVIPDGVGVSYTNDLNLDCFDPAATITNATDISSICIDIEHSYIHDLTMTLTCPNGTTIDLYVTYPGAVNNVQFGQPVDNDLSATLGTPYTYCFTNTATNTIYSIAEPATGTPPTQNYIDNDGTNVVGASYIPAGNYLSDQGFNNLIGCPLNGDWTISVTDGLNSDNGAIFNWSIDFAPALYTTNNNFTPTISSNWIANPTITSNVGNTITVLPTTTGLTCYQFQSTDQFGCVNDTTICFNVTKPVATFLPTPSQISIIDQTSIMNNLSTGATNYLWILPGNTTTTTTSPEVFFNLTSNETALITLFAYSASGCVDSASYTMSLIEEVIFYAPNAFTPNTDENNRVFLPIITSGIDLASYRMTVFNRLGEIVFVSNDAYTGWDGTNKSGKVAPDGVYIYVLDYNLKSNDDRKTFEGHVTLLR